MNNICHMFFVFKKRRVTLPTVHNCFLLEQNSETSFNILGSLKISSNDTRHRTLDKHMKDMVELTAEKINE